MPPKKQTRLLEKYQEITAFEQRNNDIVFDSDLYLKHTEYKWTQQKKTVCNFVMNN